MLKVGTLFSGGLEFALKYENIPHEIVFACEWDKYARKQYLAFHGHPKGIYEWDVRLFLQKPFNILMPDYKDLDLLVWGSPCQDLSLAGQRLGFNGDKSVLFREGARITKEIMPKVVIFENVKGLLSSNNGNDFKEVLKTFRDMGYFITHKVLNTKNYGTAQNRERIFIVGFKDVEEYHKFNFEPGIKLEKCLKDYLDLIVDEKYYLSEKLINCFLKKDNDFKGSFSIKDIEKDIANCIDAKCGGGRRTSNFIHDKKGIRRLLPK